MPATVVVGLLLAVGELQSATGRGLIDAATEALGPSVTVVVKQSRVPSDVEALRLEEALSAMAVATVSWSAATATADIRIHHGRGDRWISRRLSFLASDTPGERGRALGFALATMLLSEAETITPQEAPAEAPAQPQQRAHPDGTQTSAAAPPAPAKPAHAAETSLKAADTTTAIAPAAPGNSIELAALGTRGLGGPATGWGGAIHVEHGRGGGFHLRGGAGVRVGAVPGLKGYDRVMLVSAGATWRPFDASPTRRMGVGVSLEGALLYHDFSHELPNGGDVHQGRALPAALATVEGTWRVAPFVDILGGVASEIAFGTTDVLVAREVVGTVPILRLQARLGVRLRAW